MAGELYLRYWNGRRRPVPPISTADAPTSVTPVAAMAARRRPDPPYRWPDHAPPEIWLNPRRFMPRTETVQEDNRQHTITGRPPWLQAHFTPADTTVVYQYPRRRPVPPKITTLQHTIRRIPRQRRQAWRWEAHVLPPHRGTGRRFPMLPAQLVTRYQNITWRPSRRRPWQIQHFALVDYWINPRWMPRTETIVPQPEAPEEFVPLCPSPPRRVTPDITLVRRADRDPEPGVS